MHSVGENFHTFAALNYLQVLDEIYAILYQYESTHSRDEYIQLLDSRSKFISNKKGTSRQSFPPRKKRKDDDPYRGAVPSSGPPNVNTRKHNPERSPTEGHSSVKDSNLTPTSVSQTKGRCESEDSGPLSSPPPSSPEPQHHDPSENATTISTLPILPKPKTLPMLGVSAEEGTMLHTVGASSINNLPSPTSNKSPSADTLQCEIEHCKTVYANEDFIIYSDDLVTTVDSKEIPKFFSSLSTGAWLSDRHLNPLISSFPWPRATLFLPSSFGRKFAGKQSQRARWPLNINCNRIILPYNAAGHWTLVEIDLIGYFVHEYNSLGEDKDRLTALGGIVEDHVAYALGMPELKLDIVSKVSHIIVRYQ